MKSSVLPLLKSGAEISVHLQGSKRRCFYRKKKKGKWKKEKKEKGREKKEKDSEKKAVRK